MDAAVLELDSRAGDQVLDRARDEDFARPRQRSDTGTHVDSDAGDTVPMHLALAGVEACPDRQANRLDGVADRDCTADRARRPVERSEEAVTRGIDLSTAEPFELPADSGVMGVEELTP